MMGFMRSAGAGASVSHRKAWDLPAGQVKASTLPAVSLTRFCSLLMAPLESVGKLPECSPKAPAIKKPHGRGHLRKIRRSLGKFPSDAARAHVRHYARCMGCYRGFHAACWGHGAAVCRRLSFVCICLSLAACQSARLPSIQDSGGLSDPQLRDILRCVASDSRL